MTDDTDPTKRQKLAANFAISWKMASNWVMGAAGVAFAFYLSLPLEQQQAVLAHLPVPPWVLPLIASFIGFAARIWPQKSLSPTEAENKADTTPPDQPEK
jgi:hypothetical protein